MHLEIVVGSRFDDRGMQYLDSKVIGKYQPGKRHLFLRKWFGHEVYLAYGKRIR